jgi:hypothetical protein
VIPTIPMKKQMPSVFLRRTVAVGVSALYVAPVLLCPAAARAQQSTPGTDTGGKVKRASVKSKTDNDLRLITFKTDAGQVDLLLPRELTAGDTISGTLLRTPSGKSDEERGRNGEALAGLRVELASLPPTRQDLLAAAAAEPNQKQAEDSQRLVWTLPASLPSTAVTAVLRDAGGQEIGQAAVSLVPPRDVSNLPAPRIQQALDARGARERSFILPPSGKQGAMLSIRGRFDGDAANTTIAIGEQNALVLAESPRLAVVQTPSKALGKTKVTLQEGVGTAAPTATVQGDFDHQKTPRRSVAGPVVGVLLMVGVIIALSIASFFKGGFGGPWGAY